jgi:hypothetical protein
MKSIFDIMEMLSHEYSGRFPMTAERIELWKFQLSDFNPEIVYSAAMHYLSLGNQFPPTIGQVRGICCDLKHGELVTKSPPSAWSRVMAFARGKDVALDDIELEAMKQTGTSYDLAHSENTGIDRAYFTKAYNAIVEKRRIERVALPAVKDLANANAPALPAPAAPKEEQAQEDVQPVVDQEEVQKMIQNTIDGLRVTPEWDK